MILFIYFNRRFKKLSDRDYVFVVEGYRENMRFVKYSELFWVMY